ncbi:L-amino acid N-acyltransferase YncA [Anaerosphaera aminiphila DSM 21120]|uniref:L-amino acid N-acyltransferase YncA n=1 Tax=Anaerosphaera aminiphila DSM 21120 TaxID=1120995 RepID=A0A1M5QB62_9FIRM|nr:GNAT family N-acetyltransferase [Anaerosphaera aminiphila]SHH11126.1 L-amino acid N-acyltransferase YncA [Anaerosphaera aminiphila DSM 21120]
MNKNNLTFRYATVDDIPLVLSFIKELAEYEKMSEDVIATEDLLREMLFEKKRAEVFFALLDESEIGFALFFHNFSTFLGRAGLYLEDIYIQPQYRGNGYGKQIFKELSSIALERGCGRLELLCLDWNQPSIDFYKSMGAEPLNEWTVHRITSDKFKSIIEK